MDIYTITQVAEILNLHGQTLRKWEKDFDLKIPRNTQGHRYYTKQEIDLFTTIQKMKEEGANKHVINKILNRSASAKEQKEQALELVTLDKLTGSEFKELMINQISELMIEKERELTLQYEEKLDCLKEDLKEEIREEFSKQQEQREIENKKFIEYIALTREEKRRSFWDRFKK